MSRLVSFLAMSLVLVAPFEVESGDWPHFGFDSGFTAHAVQESRIDATNVGDLELKWGIGCDDGYFSVISRSPAIVDGVLYTSGAGDRLRAFDSRSGTLLWEFGEGNYGWAPQPVVSDRGIVFYMEGSIPTQLYAVDATTGHQLWMAPLAFDLGFNDSSLVTVDETRGVVYVVEEPFAPGAGRLFALDIETGEVEWFLRPETDGMAFIGDFVVRDENALYVAVEIEQGYSTIERVVAIDPDTQEVAEQFQEPSQQEYLNVESVSLCGERLIVVFDDSYSDASFVVCYDVTTGETLWTREEPLGVTGRIACNRALGHLYLPTDGELVAVDMADGGSIWGKTAFGAVFNPSVANGVVYFISDTNMYAVAEDDGRQLLRFGLGYEGYETTQVAVADGMVFFSGNGGTCDLYALGLPGDDALVFDGVVPAAASNAGAGGTRWGTTVWISHDSVFAEDVRLTLYAGNEERPASSDATFVVDVPAGQVVRLDDVLSHFPDVDPPAALFYTWEGIDPGDGLVATRTFTRAPGGQPGTLGQGIIGVDIDQLPPPGESHVVPLAPDTRRFRTNLGVVNVGSGDAALMLRLHDQGGAVIHTTEFNLSAGSWRQFNRVFSEVGIEPVEGGYAEVAPVAAGSGSGAARFVIYASLVDNATGDPTYFAGQWRGNGGQEVVIPVAAHNPGVGGTQWVTDVHIVNWGAVGSASTDYELLAEGQSNVPDPYASATASLGPDEHLFVPDIVLSWFGEGNRKGAILCEPEASQNLWSRTYNTGPDGTYGQSLPGLLTTDHIVTTFDAGMLIGLEESDDFRTNLGLVNPGVATASVTLRVYDRFGSMVDVISVDIEPHGMQQISASGALGVERDGRVEITSQEGVIAYASVIDNITGDATTMLAKPVGW
jgi:outer membrane protein assembly factor BamB